MAQVEFTPEAVEQADELPETIAERLRKTVDRLKKWPEVSGAKALSGDLAGSYRLRTGDYRIRFYIKGNKVVIDKIGHRSKFYED